MPVSKSYTSSTSIPQSQARRAGVPSPWSRLLPTQLTHVAADGSQAVFEAMLFGLMQDGQAEEAGDLLIPGAGAQRCTQVHLAIGHQAGAQLTIGGQAEPVAAQAH